MSSNAHIRKQADPGHASAHSPLRPRRCAAYWWRVPPRSHPKSTPPRTIVPPAIACKPHRTPCAVPCWLSAECTLSDTRPDCPPTVCGHSGAVEYFMSGANAYRNSVTFFASAPSFRPTTSTTPSDRSRESFCIFKTTLIVAAAAFRKARHEIVVLNLRLRRRLFTQRVGERLQQLVALHQRNIQIDDNRRLLTDQFRGHSQFRARHGHRPAAQQQSQRDLDFHESGPFREPDPLRCRNGTQRRRLGERATLRRVSHGIYRSAWRRPESQSNRNYSDRIRLSVETRGVFLHFARSRNLRVRNQTAGRNNETAPDCPTCKSARKATRLKHALFSTD